jgi:hypothetical protein
MGWLHADSLSTQRVVHNSHGFQQWRHGVQPVDMLISQVLVLSSCCIYLAVERSA